MSGAPHKLAGSDEQRAAIAASTTGSVYLSAPPGSGKTLTLTLAVRECMRTVDPSRICCMTFTRAAAHELALRIKLMSPQRYGRTMTGLPTIGTFHAIAYELVRDCWRELGYRSPSISIWSPEDVKPMIAQVVKLTRAKVSKSMLLTALDGGEPRGDPDEIVRGVELYKELMRGANAVDYRLLGELAVRTFLHKIPPWTHLFADEVQDTDQLQVDFLSYLASPVNEDGGGGAGARIFMVGDDDQMLYAWRGASIDRLQGMIFLTEAKPMALTVNHRNPEPILSAAQRLIQHNRVRLNPDRKMRPPTGTDKPGSLTVISSVDEVFPILRGGAGSGGGGGEAILCRTHREIAWMASMLAARGVPFHIFGGRTRMVEQQQEARWALAYLAFPYFEHDQRFMQLVLECEGLLGLKAAAIAEDAAAHGRSLLAATLAQVPDLRGWYSSIQTLPLIELLVAGIERVRQLRGGFTPEVRAMLLKEISHFISESTIGSRNGSGFVRWLMHAQHEDTPFQATISGTVLMTIHAAKGLEFDRVIIAGLRDGAFPNFYSAPHATEPLMDDERRCMYVAMTRARRELILLVDPQRPSRFVIEAGLWPAHSI